MGNHSDYDTGEIVSRSMDRASDRVGSPNDMSHHSTPTEQETCTRETLYNDRTSGHAGRSSASFRGTINDAPRNDHVQTNSESTGGIFEFLLVNPLTNRIDAQAGPVRHTFRPRACRVNTDILDLCSEDDLNCFQEPFPAMPSDAIAAGDDAGIADTRMTGSEFDLHPHNTPPSLVRQRHPLPSIHESGLTVAVSGMGHRGSLPYLFHECESLFDEWTGLPIRLSKKPFRSNMGALLSDVSCSSIPRIDDGWIPPPETPDPMFWSALLTLSNSTTDSPSTPDEARCW